MTAANLGYFAATPAVLVLGYGLARAGASACNEMRNAVFAKASILSAAGRGRAARWTF